MKKELVIIVGFILLGTSTLAGTNALVLESTSHVTNLQSITKSEMPFSFCVPTLHYDKQYIRIDVGKDMTYTITQGSPMMPYRTETLTFPLGTTITDVTVAPGPETTLTLDRKIIPAPRPLLTNMHQSPETTIEGPIYTTSTLYPDTWADWCVNIGMINDEHVVILTIKAFPTRYAPASNELVYIDEMTIGVEYTTPAQPTIINDEYDLIIIAPSAFESNLQPLVEHKENHGVATKLVTLEGIYSGTYFTVQGRDDAEKIKYFIKDALEDWGITYILLVGGRNKGYPDPNWWLPVRESYLKVPEDPDDYYISDLYYMDIYKYVNGTPVFDDWDSNGNSIFGQWNFQGNDKVDRYPDLYLGRLPCRNAYEVDIMVEKIITYETSTYGQPWSQRYLGIGGDTFPGDQWYDGEECVVKTIEYLSQIGVEGTTLFTSDGTLTKGQDIIDAVSEGYGFLNFEGHGNPMSWANHPPQDGDTWIGIDETQFIFFKNKGMYPICMIGGCSNSKFDISLLNLLDIKNLESHYSHSTWGPECFSEWMTRKVDGGAISTIGCTSYGYGSSGDSDGDGIFDGLQYSGGFIDMEFFRVIAQEGKDTLGAAHAGAITNYLLKFSPLTDKVDGKTVEEWVLFGDPSLKIGGYPS